MGDRTDWFLADHLGSTRALINDSGVIQRSFTYDAFGKLVGESGNAGVDTRYRFTGREWDGESQQYYYRARYYDANTGRFIGQDPLGFAAGDSNLYRYVFNVPTRFIDPSGLRTEIYIHEGRNFYGHAAININGTVYTYGMYNDSETKRYTQATKGRGVLYAVREDFYLNSESFTDPKDTVHRYQIDLTANEEKELQRYYTNLLSSGVVRGKVFQSKDPGKQGKTRYIGGLLKKNYHFLSENCVKMTLSRLPRRYGNRISTRSKELEALSSSYGEYPPSTFTTNPQAPALSQMSPQSLKIILDTRPEGVTPIKSIQVGKRRWQKSK